MADEPFDLVSDFKDFQTKRAAGGTSPAPSFSKEDWKDANELKLQRTLDGDTLEGSDARGFLKSVRFAGLDAPEESQGDLGPAAHAFVDEMLKDKDKVRIGSAGRDAHGRVVSTIWVGDKLLNIELVRAGHAKVYDRYIKQLDPWIQQAMLDAQDEAKAAGRGIWDPGAGYQDSEDYRRAQEAVFGAGAAGMGHDRRARVDEGILSLKDDFNHFLLAKAAKGENSILTPKPRQDPTPDDVPFRDRYPEEDGFLGHVLGGLAYPGNVAKSELLGAIEGNGLKDKLVKASQYGHQALLKKRQTTGERLKDATTQALGLGKVRFGDDDGRFQLGDIPDEVANLGVDIATDPLMYLSGPGAALKEAGPKTAAAGRAMLGAVFGYGSADEHATIPEKIGATLAGAGAGIVAGPALDAVGAKLKESFDSATDAYAAKTRPTLFGPDGKFKDDSLSKAKAVVLDAFDKVKNRAEMIRQGRLDALRDLDPMEKMRVRNVMADLKTESIRRRKVYEEALDLKDGTPEWNHMMRQVNQEVTDEYLPKIVQEEGEKIADAVGKWTAHNERVIEQLNKDAFGIVTDAQKADAEVTGKGIVGLKFHVDDVFEMDDIKKIDNVFLKAQIKKARSLSRSDAVHELGPDVSYAVYSEKFAKNFLDDAERKALDMVKSYKDTPAANAAVRGFEKGLHGYDKLTNFIKGNMLYFSLSWVKNNYWDNLTKSLVENGLMGLRDSASMAKFHKGLAGDIRNLYMGNIKRAYEHTDMLDMLKLGVLDNPTFKSLNDEFTRDFIYRPEEVVKADEKKLGSWIARASDAWWNKNPIIHAMSNVGSFMEGTARATTYLNTLKTLRLDPEMAKLGDEVLKEKAAEIVKKTFFDYGDVTAFEKAVFKRLIPFYSFYSKNLPYWAKATFDPERVGRVVVLEKARRAIGRDPNAADYAGMTPYLRDNAPRKLGKDEKGNQQFITSPSGSQYDAIRMTNPIEWGKQIVEKGNVLPKTVYELLSGKDLFTGDEIYPKDNPGGKKYIFSRGFKWYVVKQALEQLGFDPEGVVQSVAGTGGVHVDRKGNPYTTDGWNIVLDKITSTVIPHGFVDQIAGSAGKMWYDKESLDDVIFNRLSPLQKIKVSPGYARMVRQRNEP